ncbi:MAG: PIN domain-containing protein [Chloroflexi bacterium]|nr:PIN domain-containing protein [Chloroflexota bacterium]
MAYVALLDADVLHPYVSVDLLLRLAERRMFRPAWSDEILTEVRDSLVRRGIDPEKVDHRLDVMREAFPEALTSQIGRFLSAVPASVDPGDRHVVAAALAARAEAIVTRNASDFAPTDLFELGIEVQSLDTFLVNQWTLDPEVVRDALREMEEDRTRPPRTEAEILDALAALAPSFVDSARASPGD